MRPSLIRPPKLSRFTVGFMLAYTAFLWFGERAYWWVPLVFIAGYIAGRHEGWHYRVYTGWAPKGERWFRGWERTDGGVE